MSGPTAYTPTTTQPITNYIPVLLTAAAGVARFDHNPLTGESLGLLVEEQRTNLIRRSEEFDDAAWTKTNSSITANTIVAPDGLLSGDKLVENTATADHAFRGDGTISAGATISFSIYAKAAERTNISLQVSDTASTNLTRAFFNLSDGTASGLVQTGDSTLGSTSITAVGNGWYRCVLTGRIDASATTARCRVSLSDASNDVSYTGDGYSGLFIWGAQLEAGAFPTSYIPTVAASVTRNADAASMTGTNFSSWYRADEGTLYGEFIQSNQNTTFRGITRLADLSSNSIGILIASNSLSVRGIINLNGVAQASLVLGNTTAGQKSKAAVVYKTDDVAGVLNAGSVLTDSSVILPVVDRLTIGEFSGGALNGYINKIAFYPTRLSDAQLQALTTV